MRLWESALCLYAEQPAHPEDFCDAQSSIPAVIGIANGDSSSSGSSVASEARSRPSRITCAALWVRRFHGSMLQKYRKCPCHLSSLPTARSETISDESSLPAGQTASRADSVIARTSGNSLPAERTSDRRRTAALGSRKRSSIIPRAESNQFSAARHCAAGVTPSSRRRLPHRIGPDSRSADARSMAPSCNRARANPTSPTWPHEGTRLTR